MSPDIQSILSVNTMIHYTTANGFIVHPKVLTTTDIRITISAIPAGKRKMANPGYISGRCSAGMSTKYTRLKDSSLPNYKMN